MLQPHTKKVARQPKVRPKVAPDAGTERLLAASTPTKAGRYFLPPPVDPHRLPAAPDSYFIVHVLFGDSGFRVAGRPVPPRMLAKAIRSCREWRGRPVLIITTGNSAVQVAGGALLSALAVDLDVPVIGSDAVVQIGPRTLITAGNFVRWTPPSRRVSGGPVTVRLGPILPRVIVPRRPKRSAVPRIVPKVPFLEEVSVSEAPVVSSAPPVALSTGTSIMLVPGKPIRIAARRNPSPAVPPRTYAAPSIPAKAVAEPVQTLAPPPALAARSSPAVTPGDTPTSKPEEEQASEKRLSRWMRSLLKTHLKAKAPVLTATSTPPLRMVSAVPIASAEPVLRPEPDARVPDAIRPGPEVQATPEVRADSKPRIVRNPRVESNPPVESNPHVTTKPQAEPEPRVEIQVAQSGQAGKPATPRTTKPAAVRTLVEPLPEPLTVVPAAKVSSRTGPGIAAASAASEPSHRPDSSDSSAISGDGAGAQPRGPWILAGSTFTKRDREQLRSVLGWHYEAHARAVSSVLALLPSLRAAGDSADLLSALTAVRVQLSGLGSTVDQVLRGEPGVVKVDPQDELDLPAVEMLARCTNVGLRWLPAVVGPVFRPGMTDPAVLERYRSGTQLIEPAFTEARLTRQVPPGSTLEYAIWSSTARRTERLTVTDPTANSPRVLFAAGSRFLVLGVEEPGEADALPRVLLREVPSLTKTDTALDEQTRERLRESLRRTVRNTSAMSQIPAQWRLAIGVRADTSVYEPFEDQKETFNAPVSELIGEHEAELKPTMSASDEEV